MTTTLTIATSGAGNFTITLPTGITPSDYIRAANIGAGFWVTATEFIPMFQITGITVSTS